jgi:hypothetical protein|tara:strand:+ start:95 stop:307 length:213 start_codon:yes stop_codon:yes gene_type:complete
MYWWEYLLVFGAWFGVCFVVCLPEMNTLHLSRTSRTTNIRKQYVNSIGLGLSNSYPSAISNKDEIRTKSS